MIRDIAKLMQAISDAYNLAIPDPQTNKRGPFQPFFSPEDKRTYTYCNEAFSFVCKAMGYLGFDLEKTPNPFDAKLAAQIFSVMMDPAGHWREIPFSAGQEIANRGGVVGLIWDNPAGPSHVCAVMPGQMQNSASWGCPAPCVMNVGQSVFIGKKASLAFTKAELPRCFTLKDEAPIQAGA